MEAKHKTVPTSVNDAPMNGDCNHDDDERDWTSNLTWWQSLIFLPLPRRQLIFCGCTAQQLKAKHVRVSTPEIFFQFPPQVLFLGINFLPVSKFSTPTVSSFTSSSFSHPPPYDCFLMNCPSVRGSLFCTFSFVSISWCFILRSEASALFYYLVAGLFLRLFCSAWVYFG